MSKITIDQIKKRKKDSKKIVMLTAYDYPIARLLDQAGNVIILFPNFDKVIVFMGLRE